MPWTNEHIRTLIPPLQSNHYWHCPRRAYFQFQSKVIARSERISISIFKWLFVYYKFVIVFCCSSLSLCWTIVCKKNIIYIYWYRIYRCISRATFKRGFVYANHLNQGNKEGKLYNAKNSRRFAKEMYAINNDLYLNKMNIYL